MGAKQSVAIQSASEAQKERIGVFSLRGSQKQTLDVLATLLDQLLKENSLFNLSTLLSSPEKCNELFVVLSATLKKEFKTLRLPDPKNPSELHAVSYISKDAYKQLEHEFERKKVCNDIAWFIIRTVTLIASLTASVSLNKNMVALKDSIQTGATDSSVNIRYMNPVLPFELKQTLQTREPIQADILSVFRNGGQMKSVKLAGKETNDARQLVYFNGMDSVVIDTVRRIVYMPLGSETSVMSITFDPQAEYTRTGSVSAAPLYVAAPAPAPAPAPTPAPPSVPSSNQNALERTRRQAAENQSRRQSEAIAFAAKRQTNAQTEARRQAVADDDDSSEGKFGQHPLSVHTATTVDGSQASRWMGAPRPVSRKSRKNRKGSKATRKFRKVGGGVKFFLVTLKNLINCPQTGCEVETFYMDENANTLDADVYKQFVSGSIGGIPTSTTFANRLQKILTSSRYEKVSLEDVAEQQVSIKSEFGSLFTMKVGDLSAQTYDLFSQIKNNIAIVPEGASPAQYRAFLLATSFDEDYIQTLFCDDAWEGKRVTNIVSYALLNALYFDRQEGSMETLTRSECANKVAEFVGAKVLTEYVQPGADVKSFESAAFPKRPAALAAFCEQINKPGKGTRRTRSPEDKAILTDAHKQLRDLYDEQIKKAVDLIRKVMLPKNAGYGNPPLLVLSETFATDPRGAMVVLEENIKEARNLLANHYLAVEKVYRTALNKMKERVQGVYTPNVPTSVASTRLEEEESKQKAE